MIINTKTNKISTPILFFTATAEASVTLETDSAISPIPGIAPAVFWITDTFALSTTGVIIICKILLPESTTIMVRSSH